MPPTLLPSHAPALLALADGTVFEGISIGVLAEDLKLSKSGLFAHFRSKEALQLAVIEHASERFTETIVRPTLAAPRGEPRLKAAFDNKSGALWPGQFVNATITLDTLNNATVVPSEAVQTGQQGHQRGQFGVCR